MERRQPGAVAASAWAFVTASHGVYCIGCCWGLMVVLVVAGAMGLAWVAVITVVVFAEKLLPPGRHAARLAGIALLVLGAAVAFRPELVSRLAMM